MQLAVLPLREALAFIAEEVPAGRTRLVEPKIGEEVEGGCDEGRSNNICQHRSVEDDDLARVAFGVCRGISSIQGKETGEANAPGKLRKTRRRQTICSSRCAVA